MDANSGQMPVIPDAISQPGPGPVHPFARMSKLQELFGHMSCPLPSAALSGAARETTVNECDKYLINPLPTEMARWALHGAPDPGGEESGAGCCRR